MFVVVWQFEIAEDKIAAFEAAYGPQGAWAQLFRSSAEYRGTELLRDAYVPGNYLTIDRWASEEPESFDRRCHDVRRSQLLGPIDQRREDRYLRWTERRPRNRDADAEGIDEPAAGAAERYFYCRND